MKQRLGSIWKSVLENKRLALVTCMLMVVVIAVLDFFTGFEISFSVFYLAPVLLASWVLGTTGGIIFSVFSALLWQSINLLAGETFSNPWIPLWNALIRMGFYLVASILVIRLHEIFEHEKAISRIDFLTETANSRGFYETANKELSRSSRYHRPVSVLYLDLDDFKQINEVMGHGAGDKLLQTVGSAVMHSLRTTDTVARIGGDEFIVLLPETDSTAAMLAATKVKIKLEQNLAEEQWPITFSIGVVSYMNKYPQSVDEMVNMADNVMYGVKKTGKNGIQSMEV